MMKLFFIIGIIGLVALQIIREWLLYKQRGRVQPDDPKDENPPVITGPADAIVQRQIDLSERKKK